MTEEIYQNLINQFIYQAKKSKKLKQVKQIKKIVKCKSRIKYLTRT